MLKIIKRYYSPLMWRSKQNPKYSHAPTNFGQHENYLILDFECTCDKNRGVTNQEIIEFPCLWTDSNMNVISTFHRYIRPLHNPVLTPFCTQLTGISQAMIENEDTFSKVLEDFGKWHNFMMNSVGLDKTYTFISCGDWDLKIMLPDQCRLSGVPVPKYMSQWIDLKKIFWEVTNQYPKSLKQMREYCGIPLVGKEHSGIGDCQTILQILRLIKEKRLLKEKSDTSRHPNIMNKFTQPTAFTHS